MDNQTIIINFIIDELLEDESISLTGTTSLFQERILDSLNLVSLISYLEETFNCKIDPSEVNFENMDTVTNMLAFIEKKKT